MGHKFLNTLLIKYARRNKHHCQVKKKTPLSAFKGRTRPAKHKIMQKGSEKFGNMQNIV